MYQFKVTVIHYFQDKEYMKYPITRSFPPISGYFMQVTKSFFICQRNMLTYEAGELNLGNP